MAYMDIEKDANVTAVPVFPMMDGKPISPLEQYRLLVGDIFAEPPTNRNEESFYHEIVAEERKAKFMYFFSGLLFVSPLHPDSPTTRPSVT